MGMIWRSTMPLLSTLAALIIIVHSAEEELERGYRRDLRPRAVDATSYEQPWRAIEMGHLLQQPTRVEAWIESPDAGPPRRRPFRKRKRRPLTYPDTEPQERQQESIQVAYHDAEFHDPPHTMEAPRKRRKRPDRPQSDQTNHQVTDEPVKADERPLRRRGLRKKRPDYDDQLSDVVTPIVFDPDDDLSNEKRLPNYNKYNDEYEEIENEYMDRNNSETNNLKGQHKINYDKNKHVLDYKEHGSEEQRKQSIGIAESVSLVSSSEENRDIKQKTIHENSTEPPGEIILENGNISKLDGDIMVMINKPKVEKLKLGIIINGTQQSYFPLKLPLEDFFDDYGELVVTATQATDKISTENKYILSDTVVVTATQSTDKMSTENKYILSDTVVVTATQATDNFSTENKYILSDTDNFVKQPNDLNLEISTLKVLDAYDVLNTENLDDLSYGEKSSTIANYGISESSIENSNGVINFGRDTNELNYILFPISSKKVIAIYNGLSEGANTTYTQMNSSKKHFEQPIIWPMLKEESSNSMPKEVNISKEGITLDYDMPNENVDISKDGFLLDYDTPEEDVYILKENLLVDHAKPKEQVAPKEETLVDLDMPKDLVYITKSSKKVMHQPSKWINTNKWINIKKWIASVYVPATVPPEDDFQLESILKELEESGALKPMILKQLLKRSNGSSLSEILQRHNLSLTDLLQGRDEAISAINADASGEPQSQFHDGSRESNSQLNGAESKYPTRRQALSKETNAPKGTSADEEPKGSDSNGNIEKVESVTYKDIPEKENRETRPRMSTKRRFPTGIRRKLRMRPMLNSTLKAQLSRDLIAMSARKYSHNNRNVTKSREWKDIVPMMVDRSNTDDEISKDDVTELEPTTTDAPIDTTISSLEISNSSYSIPGGRETSNLKDIEVENGVTTTEATTTITIEVFPADMDTETEKPKITPIVRPAANNSTLRRQVFNNRLKRKRMKQKTSTTENPTDELMRNFLGMANLVSASQFIERTQKPYANIKEENTEFATELEDFLTTLAPDTIDSVVKSTQVTTTRSSTSSTTKRLPQATSTSTEQSAKFEIEEILNDTMTSERLAKILRERNMTLNELVNHRERGSSHVHLADIFHNASKEPNPPEPFLTKSSIEPISKETYPLRAILEANTHETTTRSLLGELKNYIPVVMDFRNNVNENGESMGIISLFNKLTDSEVAVDKAEIRKDSNGTPYVTSVISVNATNVNDTNREGRVLTDGEDWDELLSFMKSHNISTFEDDLESLDKGDINKESLEDLDEDGLMVLEDMQHLPNFENKATSSLDDNIELHMTERRETVADKPGILNKLPSNTKSVAIATATILGLAAVLFLLTYITFKWKQQRNKMGKKESFCDVQIPTPVFENRKGHKNNCSSRSISPMISNTNIYMSTLESNGKESPDYMWNSLRKPFQ